MTTFNTLSEAQAAGYTRGERVGYRGMIIQSVDASEWPDFGYHYAVGISVGPHWEPSVSTYELSRKKFGAADTVSLLQERNRMRQPGCLAPLYSAAAWQQGVSAAMAAIDGWFDAHPSAAAELAEYEDWRAATDRRQALKRLSRAAARRNAIA